MSRKYLLGIPIDCLTQSEVLERVGNLLNDGKQHIVTTVNPEFVVDARKDGEFRSILQRADLSLPDGIGVQLATQAPERLSGVDVIEKLLYQYSHLSSGRARRGKLRVFLLGGRGGIAERTGRVLEERYPNVRIVGTYEGNWGEGGDREIRKVIQNAKVKSQNYNAKVKNGDNGNGEIDLLLVAFGHGKQEKWIARNLPRLPVKVAIGVGGAFDYLSGKVPRAPQNMRDLGLEWLFRLIVQPWRIKRQWKLLYFVLLVTLSLANVQSQRNSQEQA